MKKDKSKSATASSVSFAELEPFVREQVQQLVQRMLDEEVAEFLGRDKYERGGRKRGYRNGYGRPKKLTLQSGTIVVQRPRLRDVDERFESRLLPLFAKQTKEVRELLPKLYLHGLALGDFDLAVRGLLGDGAALSPGSLQRLKTTWQAEYNLWRARRLDDRKLVYAWADGIYVKAGLEKEKAAVLVIIGAMADGTKEVLALTSGYRESKDAWADVLRDLRDRGLVAPKLLVADGNLGIWAAAAEVWPEVREQRCWNHKIMNVRQRLPRRQWEEARRMLSTIPYAPTRAEADRRRDQFSERFSVYADAVQTLSRDWERMTSFYDFPEDHWIHLRTTNIVESPFASVRLRTDAAKRFKRVPNATALIWKMLLVVEKRFHRLQAEHRLVDVLNGRRFIDGHIVTDRTQVKVAA